MRPRIPGQGHQPLGLPQLDLRDDHRHDGQGVLDRRLRLLAAELPLLRVGLRGRASRPGLRRLRHAFTPIRHPTLPGANPGANPHRTPDANDIGGPPSPAPPLPGRTREPTPLPVRPLTLPSGRTGGQGRACPRSGAYPWQSWRHGRTDRAMRRRRATAPPTHRRCSPGISSHARPRCALYGQRWKPLQSVSAASRPERPVAPACQRETGKATGSGVVPPAGRWRPTEPAVAVLTPKR